MEAANRMKKLIAIALLALVTLSAQEIKHGPKGGCYTVVKRKSDQKEYKKYVKCPEVKK